MKILHPDSQLIGGVEITGDELVIATTRADLRTLANALNEALEALEEWEFATRMGVTSDQARALRSCLNELL